jgi:hypothetical protein
MGGMLFAHSYMSTKEVQIIQSTDRHRRYVYNNKIIVFISMTVTEPAFIRRVGPSDDQCYFETYSEISDCGKFI